MKQFKINNAYKTLEKLAANTSLSQTEQWRLYKVRKVMRPHVEFYDEQMKMINDNYQEFADDHGVIHGEKAEEYANETTNLNNLEVDMEDYERPEIRFVEGMDFRMAEDLEGFIVFIPPEGE